MTISTADAGRYGETIPVTLERGIGRTNVYSTTATVGEIDPGAFEADRPVRLGWIIRDGRTWKVYAHDFARNASTDIHAFTGRLVSVEARNRREAVNELVWHVACHGRTWLVSEVR